MPLPADAPAAAALVRRSTGLIRPEHVPELALHLTDDLTGLWERMQAEDPAAAPPFWAVAWIGGQALARHLLDHPGVVRGRTVLDVGTGSGVVALAAAAAGARTVLASDVDPLAGTALALNAEANALQVAFTDVDLLDGPPPVLDVVLAGDVCYEQPMADRLMAWLRTARAAGAEVLVGDPGRDHAPRGLEVVDEQELATTREVDGVRRKRVRVLRLP